MRFLPCLFKKKRKPVVVLPRVVEEINTGSPRSKLVGIDIYWRDVVSDWTELAKHIDFMFIKATEGDWRDDPKFKEFRATAKKVGIPCGFYHFYRSDKSPKEQAKDLIRVVGQIEKGELPIVCDWETEDDKWDGDDANEVMEFLNIIEKHFEVKPIIYSGSHFMKKKNLHQIWTQYPLWVAHYTSAPAPRMPAPWTRYTFWQNSSTAIVKGMGKPCDHNYFNGTVNDLQEFIK